MEPEYPDDRPESPKKKIRPSSTTNPEVTHSDGQNATDGFCEQLNGLAPTRRDREAVASSSSEKNHSKFRQNDPANIQEETVSSSENTVHGKKKLTGCSDRDPDTNEAETSDPSRNSEAEKKEL